MNRTTIEQAIALALRCNWSWTKFGRELTGPPYTLTPPEATVIMDEYRRRYPNTGYESPQKLPRRERKVVAKAVEQIRTNLPTVPAEVVVSTARPSIINRSAVKAYALKVSKERRAGIFKRVSKEFLDSVEGNLEALIREISQGYTSRERVVPDAECDWFINGRTLRCAEEKLNEAVQKIVLAKVHGHPSIGKTLK